LKIPERICFANENEDVTSKALLKSFLRKTAKAKQMRLGKLFKSITKKTILHRSAKGQAPKPPKFFK
ncbi:MAG: hypothetical protein XD53_1346, partial [Petrotoga mobilis]